MMIRQLLLILLVGQALFTIPLQAQDRGTHPIEQHATDNFLDFITQGPYRTFNDDGDIISDWDNDLQILLDEDVVTITMDEIWEVLQIIEQRLPEQSLYTIAMYDPCIMDELCMAQREVNRIKKEREENAKIKSLIRKFREVMK